MDALSALVIGLLMLPSIIGIGILLKKFDIDVSLGSLKKLLNKLKNRD